MSIERGEVRTPLGTHADAPTTVVLKFVISRIDAAVDGRNPRDELSTNAALPGFIEIERQSMGGKHAAGILFSQTATAFRQAAFQIRVIALFCLTAVASTEPVAMADRFLNNHKPTKSATNHAVDSTKRKTRTTRKNSEAGYLVIGHDV
jgi:hypothetical protein